MKTGQIKSSWFALHPTKRVDAPYWLKVIAALESIGVDANDATPDQVKAAMAVADATERLVPTQTLEALIDAHGLLHVLTGLELVCAEKAAMDAQSASAAAWRKASILIADVARKASPLDL